MIDYSGAGEYANEVRAFSIIESGENPEAVGDGGQAYSLVQLHPATMCRWSTHAGLSVSETYASAGIKICAAYLTHYGFHQAAPAQQDLIIQAWNLGEAGVFIDGRRNPAYLAKWKQAYAAITKPAAWDGLTALDDVAGSGLE
jgi:hypothetical protein